MAAGPPEPKGGHLQATATPWLTRGAPTCRRQEQPNRPDSQIFTVRSKEGLESPGRAEGIDVEEREEEGVRARSLRKQGGESTGLSVGPAGSSSCLLGGLAATPAATNGSIFLLKSTAPRRAAAAPWPLAATPQPEGPSVLGKPGLSGNCWERSPGGEPVL